MNIVIVAQYLRDIGCFEGNNSRFVYLAKLLRDNQCDVEIITSNYHHSSKTHFKAVGELTGIKVTAIKEPGYPKNVCLKRFSSHKILAKNIGNYLKDRKKPDVIYTAVPSLAIAEICADYCKANDIKFIADIQDLWPEAFKMVLNIPVISDIGFYPMKKQADKIYAMADEIIAVSETYAKRGMAVNNKCKEPTVVYLGTEKETFDKYARRFKKESDEIVVSYIGSLTASYDLETVIDAIARINTPVKFLVMGDGSYKERFENYAKEKGINAEFTSRLDYPEMVERLVNSDIAVNPIHKGSAGSVINKVNDYAMAGLPVVNTQESQEYRCLLEKYQAGLNCECENTDDVYESLKKLIDNDDLRKEMAGNSRRLGEQCIDRAESYKSIVRKVCGE
ncbi:Glycosyltransferase involved in cell wall bisynthesis [Dethiosulfatibacter aminovorans DSM 17477]|uniref:Glycosyltransferase involved in cell wall bisynthesis n=1 Tax=Dethiosulfatibacter aminovorans DSM 17477 TaxID=1121476 RepID=A0A1M6M6Q0_9FIRM|nr:glycosyltransferase family 4 protein [Dethiosulfatibacter aminovorans]SHJ79166.1 Glycosyltransferase involved in cell wall bisynthesis [Dethiosulfatibacter aminovorans DSM 17477]